MHDFDVSRMAAVFVGPADDEMIQLELRDGPMLR